MSRSEHTLADLALAKRELHKFAGRVFAHRLRHKLSRRALAEQVGCSESNIKNIETEESAPGWAVQCVLKRIMGEI